MDRTAEKWIEKLELQKHPEGGYYSEFYRSDEAINKFGLPSRFNASRSFSTSIFYLLEGNGFSVFHKIKSDELWHYYNGTSSVRIYIIMDGGKLVVKNLGNNLNEDEFPQVLIPKNCWFAADLKNANSFALTGCTVSPGFDFSDFEIGIRSELLNLYPQHAEVINKLTLSRT